MKSIHIFAVAAMGEGLSGSDRIFIEFARRWSKVAKVNIYVWDEGYKMCQRQDLLTSKNLKFHLINIGPFDKFGFLICYLARIIGSIILSLKLTVANDQSTIIYSASEFWMDSLPAFVLKLRYPKIKWVAAWFQTAPNPIQGFTEGNRKNTYKLATFFYWFMQLPTKPLIKRFADLVLVNNDLEKKQFTKLDRLNRAVVIQGAVNIEEINKYQKDNKSAKVYDGVFQGRFHPQKGVVELISIWKLVVKKLPTAKLAMIGDGPLMEEVSRNIKKMGLEKNIYLFGYVFDGEKKYKIFSQSKVVVHPAFYDSGGMASAEAMAFGLPCIGFNLQSYKSYYPKGMVKIAVGDLEGFANMIVQLLENKYKRDQIGKEAQEMINRHWSWDQRVNRLLNAIKI